MYEDYSLDFEGVVDLLLELVAVALFEDLLPEFTRELLDSDLFPDSGDFELLLDLLREPEELDFVFPENDLDLLADFIASEVSVEEEELEESVEESLEMVSSWVVDLEVELLL